jgi:hypothetical protein
MTTTREKDTLPKSSTSLSKSQLKTGNKDLRPLPLRLSPISQDIRSMNLSIMTKSLSISEVAEVKEMGIPSNLGEEGRKNIAHEDKEEVEVAEGVLASTLRQRNLDLLLQAMRQWMQPNTSRKGKQKGSDMREVFLMGQVLKRLSQQLQLSMIKHTV